MIIVDVEKGGSYRKHVHRIRIGSDEPLIIVLLLSLAEMVDTQLLET